MRIFILFLILFFWLPSLAQNVEADSLKRQLATTTDEAKRVVILEGLSFAYVSTSPDTALQYATEGLELAKKNSYLEGEALCTNALGNVFFKVGDYSRALEMYNRNLELKQKLKNASPAVTYFNIANVYTEQQDHRHALYYVFKTKQVDEEQNDSTGILFDLYSLSCIYLRMNDYDSALYYGQEAAALASHLQDKNLAGAIHNNFAEIYRSKNELALAAKYFQLSIPYSQAINDNEVLAANYAGLAKIYRQRVMTDSSVFFAKKSLAIAQAAPFLKQVYENSELLADLFKNKKQFDSAFKYQGLSIAIKDSIYNVEKIKKIQNYKLLEQQKQQAIDMAAMRTRSLVKLYSVIFISLVLLMIAILLWRNNKRRKKDYAALELQKEKTDEAYKELKATQEHLIHSEKMASLGELTAGIAHEIQNPLNFVNNFSEVSSELIKEMVEEADKGNVDEVKTIAAEVKQSLERINHHGKRADAIVKGMLQHSQSGSGQKELTDINALVKEYLDLTYHGIQAKDKSFYCSMHADLDEAIGKINIIPQDIRRVLLNLYNNAFYAMKEKAKSVMSLSDSGNSNAAYEPVVSVSTQKINNKVEIRVKDNGKGIPDKIRNKIFQPFFTTKPTGQGTGLGLSLAYDIMKAHGGNIRVETRENVYSEFILQMPL
ncbi:MAG: ATP-binding protein [Bacteroidota bacterium]